MVQRQSLAMMKILKDVFTIDKHPRKGLIAIEWLVLGYVVITSLFILFAYTKLDCPMEMLKGRGRVVVMIAFQRDRAKHRRLPNCYGIVYTTQGR